MNIEYGLTLLNSMQFEYKDITIWNHYLADYLEEHGVIARIVKRHSLSCCKIN